MFDILFPPPPTAIHAKQDKEEGKKKDWEKAHTQLRAFWTLDIESISLTPPPPHRFDEAGTSARRKRSAAGHDSGGGGGHD